MALMLKNDDDDKLITEMCSARCGPAEKREAGGVDGTLGSTTNVQKVVGSSWSRFPNKTVSLVYRIKRIELQQNSIYWMMRECVNRRQLRAFGVAG
ncbi:hypothetical protein MTP99_008808 [Tenebrio molitor]|nr:hypothetical protein MTP99_008808 [Tenebrio molitor]